MLSETTYTKTGQVETSKNGAGNTTTTFYDPVDRVDIVQDPENRKVKSFYDAAGQLLCTWRGWTGSFPGYSGASSGQPCRWDAPTSYAGIGPVRYAEFTYTAYVYNNPLNRIDPLGLCRTENGKIVDCTVNVKPNNLTGKELKAFNRAADKLLKNVARVGKKIQDKGNESQKTAWASLKEITVDSSAGSENYFGGDPRSAEYNPNDDSVTFYNDAVEPKNATGPGAATYAQYLVATHEIFHAEPLNRQAHESAKALDTDAEYMSARWKLEQATEVEAQQAVRDWGLLPPDVKVSSPYLQQ